MSAGDSEGIQGGFFTFIERRLVPPSVQAESPGFQNAKGTATLFLGRSKVGHQFVWRAGSCRWKTDGDKTPHSHETQQEAIVCARLKCGGGTIHFYRADVSSIGRQGEVWTPMCCGLPKPRPMSLEQAQEVFHGLRR